jgi:acylphosphatase
MKNELELYLKNANVISQTFSIIENNPLRYMKNGLWCTEYTIYLATYISGLSLRGIVKNYEDGRVEIFLTFSTYGDFHLTPEELKRREKHITHITKFGAIYKAEPQINWFN